MVVIAALILLPTILGLLIPAFGKLLLKILKALGKGLWWLICLPFRIIAAPFKAIAAHAKKKGKKGGKKSGKRRNKSKKK